MKILRRGPENKAKNDNVPKYVHIEECKSCQSLLKYHANDLIYDSNINSRFQYFTCPVCNEINIHIEENRKN